MSQRAAVLSTVAARAVDMMCDEKRTYQGVMRSCVTTLGGSVIKVAWSTVPKGVIERTEVLFQDDSKAHFSRFVCKETEQTHITAST